MEKQNLVEEQDQQVRHEEVSSYEPPQLVEIGDAVALTRGEDGPDAEKIFGLLSWG